MSLAIAQENVLERRSLFEQLLIVSFILSVIQGAIQLAPSLEVNGWAISSTKLFFSPVISTLIGFAISRLRSRIATAIYLLALCLSFWLVYLDLVEGYWNNLPFVVGLTSIIADTVAAVLIVRWMSNGDL